MAVYTDGNGRKHTTDLLKFRWAAMTEKEFNDYSDNYNYTEDAIENGWIPLNVYAELQDLAPDDTVDPIYPDLDRYVRLAYEYADTDPVKLHPLAKCIYYPVVDEDDASQEGCFMLNADEKQFFTKLLQAAIGDAHTPETQLIMTEYHNAVDPELKMFLEDVLKNREVLPITVGFINSKTDEKIFELTGTHSSGNRIVLIQTVAEDILKRHGENGTIDHSMADIYDMARMSYVLANYDEITFDPQADENTIVTVDGRPSPVVIFKKKIDDRYYIVEIISDSNKRRNIVTSSRLQ